MKKNYIQPSIVAFETKASAIMVTSNQTIPSGGPNTQPGAPTKAESKFMNFDEDFDEEY